MRTTRSRSTTDDQRRGSVRREAEVGSHGKSGRGRTWPRSNLRTGRHDLGADGPSTSSLTDASPNWRLSSNISRAGLVCQCPDIYERNNARQRTTSLRGTRMEREAIESLRAYLEGESPGPIRDREELVSVLGPAWPEFDGSDAQGMDSRKLRRMEDPYWDPPRLTFAIERHGAMVAGGSSRAELQTWCVDLESTTAHPVGSRRRQIRSMAPRIDVRALADEVVSLMNAGVDDERLRWSADRTRVTVRIGRVIPPGVKQTVEDRRRRFRKALCEAAASSGWKPAMGTAPNTFSR